MNKQDNFKEIEKKNTLCDTCSRNEGNFYVCIKCKSFVYSNAFMRGM